MTVVTGFHYGSQGAPMRVAGFMSGSGTNLIKIIEHEKALEKERGKSPYTVAVIFSDNPQSNANVIGSRFEIPVIVHDLISFCAKKGVPTKDMQAREAYERECMQSLKGFNCDVAAYAGYMRKATPVFVNAFVGVNVHPADLTILRPDGIRKYRGDHAVLDALKAGEPEIRSTTHIISEKLDSGSILMVSAPVRVTHSIAEITPELAGEYQIRLKEVGDWVIFPRTLEYMADGRIEREFGAPNNLYFDEKPIPRGIRLD